MKNEVSQRREGRVLFEPPEPLFPDPPPDRPRKILIRIAGFVMLVCIALVVWAVAASASGESESTETIPTETITEKASEEVSEEGNAQLTDTESVTEYEAGETQSESELIENSDTEESEREGESEKETQPLDEVIESDMSLAERGDAYIVNYTDKAVDISGLLDRGFAGSVEKNGITPAVMILHTHTSESYYNSENEYLDGVISVGDALTRRLNSLGLTTLHCTVIHDGGESNAYVSARETIETMLKIYPTIKYVIDLHRMELESGDIPIKTISPEGLAQMRLTVSADSLGWQENMSLALSLRRSLNEGGARLCLPPVLSSSRYNSDLAQYYLMVDIGATGNTLDEAILAAERLARALYNTVIKK